MPVIRIPSRLLVAVAIAAALCLGFLVGEAQPTSPVAAAPVGQGAPTATPAATPAAAPTALNQDLAMRLVQAAVAAAGQANIKESYSIVDASGNEMMMVRMDGANFMTPTIAMGKANATAAFGIWGAAWTQAIPSNPGFFGSLYNLGRPIVEAQGSIPIVINGTRVGAMGASGGTAQQDEDMVRAAFGAVGLTVPTQ